MSKNASADAIQLSIFASRIEAVCDEMGAVLQRAAFSPNVMTRCILALEEMMSSNFRVPAALFLSRVTSAFIAPSDRAFSIVIFIFSVTVKVDRIKEV